MDLQISFRDFIEAIRPTPDQLDACQKAYYRVQEQLEQDDNLAPIIVTMFLQGSYRRGTILKPGKDQMGKTKKLDVDLVVVTRLSKDDYPDPKKALEEFESFLERHYQGRYEYQKQSVGIDFSQWLNLDLVITSAPSGSQESILQSNSVRSTFTPTDAPDWRLVEGWMPPDKRETALDRKRLELALKSEEWQAEPLLIPNCETGEWEETNPLEVMRWTWDKNRRCNGHYTDVVKALKWWRRHNNSNDSKPKGYSLEHIIGHCVPDGINSIGDGVVTGLESIIEIFAEDVRSHKTPELNAHGVADQNVLDNVSPREFADFYERIRDAAHIARAAYDEPNAFQSAELWSELFGQEFPVPSAPPIVTGGYDKREEPTQITGGRFG